MALEMYVDGWRVGVEGLGMARRCITEGVPKRAMALLVTRLVDEASVGIANHQPMKQQSQLIRVYLTLRMFLPFRRRPKTEKFHLPSTTEGTHRHYEDRSKAKNSE